MEKLRPSPSFLRRATIVAPTFFTVEHHSTPAISSAFRSNVKAGERELDVTEDDLKHLRHLLEGKDGVMDWQSLMERSTPTMAYQAWRHEPETGPTVYRSRTVFEDATPELVRDFFWDDDFRSKWDPMLAYCKVFSWDDCSMDKKVPLFSAVIENMLLHEEYGRLEIHTTALYLYVLST